MAELLSEFARTMLTDFPINGILDRLVERIVEVLPVTAAGVTLMSVDVEPHYIAASNDAALQLEKLQSTLRQGPCVVAYESGQAVIIADIVADERFDDFNPKASEVGMAAMFAFPLRHNEGRLGALDLFRDQTGPLDDWAMTAAQTLADVAAAYLVNAQGREESGRATEVLRVSTLHDPLTGLPNRVLFQQRLDHAAQRAQRSHATAAVLFADLDGFKDVNDAHGHAVGDGLLVAVAGRLSSLLRPGDTLARVSGDEFVILCEDLSNVSAVSSLAARIGQAFSKPFTVTQGGEDPDVKIQISASVGIAFAGHADDIGAKLIRDADAAMYQVKRKGGGSHGIVDVREATQEAEHVELAHDLRNALKHGQLALAYQPIVRTADGFVTGIEALLRWNHPNRGPVPALTTIALAEQSTLINDIGMWVLERSLLDRACWQRQHPGQPLDLAVNISPRHLMSADFCASVADALEHAETDPSALVLEMTESIFLDDSERAMAVLSGLKGIGVQLALDDFGTGYSSLSYLRQFPVDIVKIDQSFVADIGAAPTDGKIVEAITNLAHVLGLQVTAEGVETPKQREEVHSFGCDGAQGYLYAKPMSADQFAADMRAQPSGAMRLPAEATT